MPKNHDIVEIDVVWLGETEKAYHVRSVDTGRSAWVPKSQCELSGTELQLPEWLATDKELI